MNIGLFLFVAEALATEGRYSAIVMGLGALMAWGAIMSGHRDRLRADGNV